MNHDIPESEKSPINAKAKIQVSRDRKLATITAVPPQNEGAALSREDIERELESSGVRFGIDRDCMERILLDPPYGRQEVLARAAPAQKGEDARIEYRFTSTGEVHPKVRPDGSVDFKDLGLVQNARAGDVLCVKIPATPGVPGTDVTGQEIPPAPGRDVLMPAGNGTKISEDGAALLAAIDGQVDLSGKRVTVMNTYTVKGDVGVGTGNIDFVGNVQVGGSITAGFLVKAAGNVTVSGMLDGGSIEAGGNVVIQDGFNGLNTGEIRAVGDLKCKYLQNGKIDIGGNVHTGSVIGCAVSSGGTINVIGAKSQIYNSSLTARHAINCVNAGSPGIARPVVMEVGSDPGVTQRRTANPKELVEARKKLEQIETLLALFQARKAKGILDPDKLKELDTLLELQRVMQNKIAELQMESLDIEQRMLTSGYGSIAITGTAKEGTHIVIGPEKLRLASDQTFVRFSRVAEKGIVTGPAK